MDDILMYTCDHRESLDQIMDYHSKKILQLEIITDIELSQSVQILTINYLFRVINMKIIRLFNQIEYDCYL